MFTFVLFTHQFKIENLQPKIIALENMEMFNKNSVAENGHEDITKNEVIQFTNDDIVLKTFLEKSNVDRPISLCGDAPLHVFIRNRRYNIVKWLLQEGKADINRPNRKGQTPLHVAVSISCTNITSVLLSYHADIRIQDRKGENPLHYAARKLGAAILEVLLKYCDKSVINLPCSRRFKTPLHYLVMNKQTNGKIIKMFIEKGADMNSRGIPLRSLSDPGEVSDDMKLASVRGRGNWEGWAPLHDMVNLRIQSELLEYFLKLGPDVNIKDIDGNTPLHLICKMINLDAAELLLRYGADPNILNVFGQSPLHLLITEGVFTRKSDTRCFQEAVFEMEDCTDLLLKYGADTELKNSDGNTPLHLAVIYNFKNTSYEFPGIVELLIKYGADINSRNLDGHTPCSVISPNIHEYHDLFKSNYEMTIFKIFGRHIIEMDVMKKYVCEENRIFPNTGYLKAFNDLCNEEIAEMKKSHFENTNISLYEFLDPHKIDRYLYDQNVIEGLRTIYRTYTFPWSLGKILHRNIERILLLNEALKSTIVFPGSFSKIPHLCAEQIFSYLDNKDLKQLIIAFLGDDNEITWLVQLKPFVKFRETELPLGEW